MVTVASRHCPSPGTLIVPTTVGGRPLRVTTCEPGGPRPSAMISNTAGPMAPEATAAGTVGWNGNGAPGLFEPNARVTAIVCSRSWPPPAQVCGVPVEHVGEV